MRRLAVSCGRAAAGAAVLGVGVVACFDLFHSTRDVQTACQKDADTLGCAADASVESASPAVPDAGQKDFCEWSSVEARAHADHACAWLSACETPVGRNAFGSCIFDALLAYDCAANPNHRAKGKAYALWDCLWRATTCDDVARCVFPDGPPGSCANSLEYTACGVTTPDDATANIDVRIECSGDGSPHGENCALWGQTCAAEGGTHRCTGVGGLGCRSRGCFFHALEWCTADRSDMGIDCDSNGAQGCGAFPSMADARWVACAPESDGAPCVPDLDAACIGGTAFSCPAGAPEEINCASLLESDAACSSGALAPPFDWTSPCIATTPECDADECTDGGFLSGCVRGAWSAAPINCVEAGLGTCRTLATDQGTVQRSSCAPP
jgi:hypothetical protein